MDELKQERLNLLKDEYDKISKELFRIEQEGIILDSGRIIPLGGYEYRNELEEKQSDIYHEMRSLNSGEKQ